MGGVCSNRTVTDDSTIEDFSSMVIEKKTRVAQDQKGDSNDSHKMPLKAQSASKTGSNKVSPMISQGGARRRAVGVLKTIGNSVSIFHINRWFFTGMASNGREISMLAFEVANTISKVENLSQSVSEENIQILKKELSQSEGIKQLVSMNMEELLSIAAADKRQEFDMILREVRRFGKQCKDTKWQNLEQYFSGQDLNDPSKKQVREARAAMQELSVLAEYTSELYHELHALETFEQDYRKKVEEMEFLNQDGKGESLTIFQGELNLQRKLLKSLHEKSLWSRNFDEIVEKLVYVMTWIDQTISNAFSKYHTVKTMLNEDTSSGHRKLGVAGLALHYANIINQISLIACRPAFVPLNARDALYRALPLSVKTAMRSRLRGVDAGEEATYSSVKAEMDKTFEWLLPLAANTIRALQGWGRVGEWASNSKESSKGRAMQSIPIRLQTLYHADKQKTEQYILELVISLHHLSFLARHQHYHRFTTLRSPSPASKDVLIPQPNARRLQLNSPRLSTGRIPARKSDSIPENDNNTESSKDEQKDGEICS